VRARALPLALLLVGVIACAGEAPQRTSLLLVTFDTTRADHLAPYGYAHVETPTLSALARAGIRYARCYTPAPLTLPAHTSLMTGLYPFRHGVRENGTQRLDPTLPSLAGALRERGYATAAVVGAYVLDSRFGLAAGFDHYDDDLSNRERPKFGFAERPAQAVTDAALAWLAVAPPSPFFLWVHYFDPHSPYAAPASGSGAAIAAPYDLEIAHADRQLGRLLEAVAAREAGGGGPTLRVFTADHGEALWEHGEPTHGFFAYEETLRVPLIVSLPSGAGAGSVIETPVSLVDLFPSILGWLGLPAPDGLDGTPLPTEPPAAEAAAERALYFESLVPERYYGWSPLRGVVLGGEKYIEAPRPELYDLEADPDEAHDLLRGGASGGARHREALAALSAGAAAEALPVELAPEDAQRLHALGYLAARGGPGDPAADPKDRVALHRRVLEAQVAIDADDAAAALATLSGVLEEDPANRRSLFLLLDLLNHPELRVSAAERLERQLDVPLPPGLALRTARGVGAAWSAEQRWSRAEPALHRALAAAPADARSHHLLSGVLVALERPEAALPHAEQAHEADPSDPGYAAALARLAGSLGQTARARELYEVVLEASPDDALALNNAAWLDYEAGVDLDRALERSERAVALDPERAEFRHTRGCLLAALGRQAEAREEPPAVPLASCSQ